jgi:hypothetical protein
MTPHHKISFGSSSLPHFNKNNFLSQYLHRHNSLRFHPCAHPQHMNVLKHFIYLYIGCWMQSAGLCSLNHDTTTSIGSTLPQLYKNKFPTSAHPHGYNSLSKVAPIRLSTAYQGAKTLHIHPIWMWDAVSGGPQPQPWFHNIIWFNLTTPFFQKITPPHLHRCYSVRVHPYAHPQIMKVLKHFIYLQYGCGMQFGTSCSLNHDTITSFGSTLPHLSKKFTPHHLHS